MFALRIWFGHNFELETDKWVGKPTPWNKMEDWEEFIEQQRTTANTSFYICFISSLHDFEPVYITMAVDSKNKKGIFVCKLLCKAGITILIAT